MADQGVGVLEVVVGVAAVAAAVVALFRRPPLAGVIAFLVFGVLVSVLWALAGAPDVALAEAALGTGITGALLIEAATGRGRGGVGGEASVHPSRFKAIVPALLGVAVAAGLGWALIKAATAPRDRPGLGEPVRAHLRETGVDQPVTAVLLNYRSYDTLLEMGVLLVAVVILASLRTAGTVPAGETTEGGRPAGEASCGAAGSAPAPGGGLGPLFGTFMRAVGPGLLLIAAWLLFAGSSRPGGAFQAGAVLAALLILFRLAGIPLVGSGVTRRFLLVAGVAGFLAVAGIGLLRGGAWLELPSTGAGAVIVALETVLAATIGVSLASMFDAMTGARAATTPRAAR